MEIAFITGIPEVKCDGSGSVCRTKRERKKEKKKPTSLRNYCIHCSDLTHRFHRGMSQKKDLKYCESEIKLTGKITREETGNKHQSHVSCR